MIEYIIKRLILMVVTLVGIVILTFGVSRLAPGDPVAMQAGNVGRGSTQNQGILDEAVVMRRRIFGLDKPIFFNFNNEDRSWFIKNALERAVGDKAFDRRLSRNELRELSTAAYPDLIPALDKLPTTPDKNQQAVALEELISGARHTIPGDLAKKPASEQVAYWQEFWKNFTPNNTPWHRHVDATVRAAMDSPNGEGRAELLRLGALATEAMIDELADHDAGPEAARAIYYLSDVQKKPGWRPDARGIVELLRDNYLPNDPTLREELRKKFIAGLSASEQAAVAGEDAAARKTALANASTFWHLPALLDMYITVDRMDAKRDIHEAIDTALSNDAKNALPEVDKLRGWPETDELIETIVEQKRAAINRWWGRDRFRYSEFGSIAHAAHTVTNTQFGVWMGKILRFDFDESLRFNRPVMDMIKERMPITLTLSFASILISYMIAIPLGIFSATNYQSRADRAITLVLFILYSMPSFWVAQMLIIFFSNRNYFDFFPSYGLGDPGIVFSDTPWRWLGDRAHHLVLPLICYTYASFAFLSRQMRSSMLETIRQDFIRTARAKGLNQRMIVYKHALRNSMIPILTLAAGLLPELISGAVILETIFTIEGMGKMTVDAVFNRDYAIINATALFSATLTLLGILLSDLSYALVDPRITFE